ncbi:MAG: hypothetical protein KIT69_17270, partial [Propionibacteriaceae bacterium]|nr:hypothetical protein [Propionibacteriaceae bacterium]
AGGSPLDGVVGWLLPKLAGLVEGTHDLGAHTLIPGITVAGSLTIAAGIAVNDGRYTGGVSATGTLALALGTVTGNATLSLTYTLVNQALGDGTLTIVLTGLNLTVGDAVAVSIASATLSQNGNDLVIAATGVTAGAGAGAVSLTGGSAQLVVAPTGITGTISGAVAVSIPGISAVSGSFVLALDTAAGTAAFTGSDISLTVLGQTLTGNVAITHGTGLTTVDVTAAAFRFADGAVQLTGGTAHLEIPTAGSLTGSVGGTLQLAIPGVAASGAFTASFNGTDSSVSVSATGASLTVAGVTLQVGTLSFLRTTTATTATVANGSLKLGPSATPYVSITGIAVDLTVTAAGVAGSTTATAALSVPGLVTGNPSAALEIDTATGFLRVEVVIPDTADDRLSIAGIGSLAGTLGFTQSSVAGVNETVVALSGVTVRIVAGEITVTDGSGLLVLRPTGIAGFISGTITAGGGPLGVSGTVAVRLNTILNAAIDTSVTLDGQTVAVSFAASPAAVLQVSISNASLRIGDFVTIEGSVEFGSDGRFAGTGLKVLLGKGPATLEGGAINPLAVGVLLRDATVGLVRVGTTYALVASGTVGIIGVPGVTLTGTTSVRFNNTGTNPNAIIEIAGSPDVVVDVADGTSEFKVTGAALGFAGLSLTGD